MSKNTKLQKILNLVYFILGFIFGYQIGVSLFNDEWVRGLFPERFAGTAGMLITGVLCGIVFGYILIRLIPAMAKLFANFSLDWIKQLGKVSPVVIVERSLATILALIIASLLVSPLYRLSMLGSIKLILILLIYSACIYFSNMLCSTFEHDVESFFSGLVERLKNSDRTSEDVNTSTSKNSARNSRKKNQPVPKILDTSVIIDGRIEDILATGFIDGPIVIPGFVVEELQHVSDSVDPLKRNRGRAGLDLVNRLKERNDGEIELSSKDYSDVPEVDAKLVRLAKDMKGKVITNDYNLNKVAEIYGVKVLNINDLSNTVKTVVLPGEALRVHVLREGKENNQGVGYHSDGTMIVIENGRSLIGKDIDTEVTSVLQTSAGRMIFVKPL